MDLKPSVPNPGSAIRFTVAVFAVSALLWAATASADSIEGQVLGAGAPIAKSTVTLWSASADAPKQLAQTQTGDDGRFTLSAEGSPDSILYIVAKGGVPAGSKSGGDNPASAKSRHSLHSCQRRGTGWQQGWRRQPGDRAHLRGRQQSPGQVSINEMTTDCVCMDQRTIPRRHRDQGQRARPSYRRWERSELRRS